MIFALKRSFRKLLGQIGDPLGRESVSPRHRDDGLSDRVTDLQDKMSESGSQNQTIESQRLRIDELEKLLHASLIGQINAVGANWNPENAVSIIDALGNIAGKPISSLFEDDFPYTMFASRHSNYSPWLRDRRLLPYFDDVNPPYLHGVRRSLDKGSTIVDIYRCWTLWQAITQLGHVPGDFIEVGAFRGGTSALIAHGIATSKLEAHLFICDTFTGVVKAGAYDNMYHGGEHFETTEALVHDIVSKFLDSGSFSIKAGIFPDETGAFLDGRMFRFAHIDVDVYQGTKESLEALWPNFSVGGIIIVDDYGLYGTEGVAKAVEEFVKAEQNALMIYNFNGQAIIHKFGLS